MNRSYRPHYHASVPSGWSNDPNGTIFFEGKAHLFYQHFPHKPEWGTMHWGHFATTDFVKWENLPVTLVPDRKYEEICGCCSGSTIEKDGKLYLMYTAAQPQMQRQCMAVSEDGVHFEKDPGNPILTSFMLSPEIFHEDFRDPRMFRKDGLYWLIAGIRWIDPADPSYALEQCTLQDAQKKTAVNPSDPVSPSGSVNPSDPDEADDSPVHYVSAVSPSSISGDSMEGKLGWGNLALLKSPDLYHWSYVGHLLYPQAEYSPDFYRLNGVYECPDYFVIDGREVLLSSPQNLPPQGLKCQNVHSGLFMLGNLNFETGRFHVDAMGEIDSGFDFYAAQTLRMPDGRVIMIAWKEMWDRNFPTRKEGWAGTYTLPRELSLDGDRLIQKPVRELAAYRKNRVYCQEVTTEDGETAVPGVAGTVAEVRFTLEPGTAAACGVKVFCGPEHETAIYYDRADGLLVFDRSRSGLPLTGREKDASRRVLEVGDRDSIDLDLFLDVNSCEVFVDGGRHVMTGNVYPDLETDTGVRFFSQGGSSRFGHVEKFDIMA
ncbi:MAG: glycoside hydrolase family 32 protein [Oscillibacter sp.]|nr:glycoside hydrolase family 32 protein [Oscillibacter sp.]